MTKHLKALKKIGITHFQRHSSAHRNIRKILQLNTKQNQNSECVDDAKTLLGLLRSEPTRACVSMSTQKMRLWAHTGQGARPGTSM